MMGHAGSMLVFLPLFFGAYPQTSQHFIETVERPIQITLEFHLAKPGELFSRAADVANKWISIGWILSRDSTSNTLQHFVETVERPIQITLELDLAKPGELFPRATDVANKWIYIGWMWSRDSAFNTLYLTHEPLPIRSWLQVPTWEIPTWDLSGGALILGEPNADPEIGLYFFHRTGETPVPP